MQKAGIVGLPNVGKSTLFNALVNHYQAEASNYPFCTTSPNIGIVILTDQRLNTLSKITKIQKVVNAVFEFVDIAGLVKGASKGEGLGNQFLSHIREVDVIVHLVRCFEDTNVSHVETTVDPIRDIEIIKSELALADLQSLDKKKKNILQKVKGHDKESTQQLQILEKIEKLLNEGKSITSLTFEKEEQDFYRSLFLLSSKPVIYVANVLEGDFQENKYFKLVNDFANKENSKCVPICAKLESDLIALTKEEKAEYLASQESGIEHLIKETFKLLKLITFFTTTGEKEVKAWTITKETKAPQGAGTIHTDFEKGFIKAEVIKYNDLIKLGSKHAVKEAGLSKLEGKEHIIQDGDIVEFKFSV